jgi:hypothetical protein
VHNLALTFGTLLSSQGADAHRLEPLDPAPGQPLKLTAQPRFCQTDHRPLVFNPTPRSTSTRRQQLTRCDGHFKLWGTRPNRPLSRPFLRGGEENIRQSEHERQIGGETHRGCPETLSVTHLGMPA